MTNKVRSKVKLRQLELSDTKLLAELFNNKKIWDNLRNSIPFPYKEDDAISFIEFVSKNKLQQVFAIEHNDMFCGIVGLVLQQDVYEKSAEMGYWIGERYWGKSIATEAVNLITEYGFNKLNLVRIYSAVFENNIASMKVLEKKWLFKRRCFKKSNFQKRKNIG